jgi:hypothetical protein
MQWLPDHMTPITTGHAYATYLFDFSAIAGNIDEAFVMTNIVRRPTTDATAFAEVSVSPNGVEWYSISRWTKFQRPPSEAIFPGFFGEHLVIQGRGYTDEIWVQFHGYSESDPSSLLFVHNYDPAIDSLYVAAEAAISHIPEPSSIGLVFCGLVFLLALLVVHLRTARK